MSTPTDKFAAFNSNNPYTACLRGVYEHPDFKKCFKCPNHGSCDIENSDLLQLSSDDYYKNLRKKSFANMEKYYFANGHWHVGSFKGVKKDNSRPEVSRKTCCYAGIAEHPNYLNCKNCPELPTCDFGKFRTSK